MDLGKGDAKQLAELLGISVETVYRMAEKKVISYEQIKNKNYYDLQECVHNYIQYLIRLSNGRRSVESIDTESKLKEAKLRAEVNLKESQGELHRLRTEIALGNYLPVEEVKLDYSRFFIIFKNFATGLPGKLAGRLQGFVTPTEVREIESQLKEDVRNALEEFVSRAIVDDTEKAQQKLNATVGDGITPRKRGRPRKDKANG